MREQGIISAHEQDLYLYLLHRSNVLYWKNPFHQSTTVLCSVLSIDRNALIARRKRLKQLELIDFVEGKSKNRPAEYSIIRLGNNEPSSIVSETYPARREEKVQNTGKKTKKNETHFSEPVVEDVETYCHERKNKVDAQRFVDFYTAKGWMLGKNKMKDWKAAVRTWERDYNWSVNNKRNSRKTDERF